jgi:DNA-binding protein H-NS
VEYKISQLLSNALKLKYHQLLLLFNQKVNSMARTTVEAQLAKLRKAKELIEKKEKDLLNRTQGRAISRIVKIAEENNISAAQIAEAMKQGKSSKPKLTGKKKPATGARGKVAPKYRNPANAAQTWTGRGKAPLWVQELKTAGSLDSALIAAA